MGTINRRIELSAEGSGFNRTVSEMGENLNRAFESANQQIERLSENSDNFVDVISNRISAIDRSASELYGNLLENSKQHGKSVVDRLSYVQRELSVGERQLRVEQDRFRISEALRKSSELKDAKFEYNTGQLTASEYRTKRASINADSSERTSDFNSEQSVRKSQLEVMKEMFKSDRDSSIQDNYERSRGGGNNVYGVGRGVLGGAMGAFGLMGLLSVSGFVGKMLSEGSQLDESRSSVNGLGMRKIGSGARFGKKQADYLGYARSVSMAAGSGEYDVESNMEFEKGFSQDSGSLNGLTAGLRTEGSGRNAGTVTKEMLNFFKRSDLFNVGRGDFTQLNEKIGFMGSMLKQQGDQMHNTNATTNSQIMEMFGNAGISDQRMMGYSDSINSSITNPNNDFSKAFIFRSLRKQNPDASLFDLLKVQEQGIFGEGSFGQIMGDLKDNFSGDALKMSTSKLFGLKFHQAEKLLGISEKDANNIGSNEDINSYLQENGISGVVGKGGAGAVSRRTASMNNWFAEHGEGAVKKIDEFISAYEKGGVEGVSQNLASSISASILVGFEGVVNKLVEIINKKMLGEDYEKEQEVREEFKKQGINSSSASTMFFGSWYGDNEKKGKIRDSMFDYDAVDSSWIDEPPGMNIYGGYGESSKVLKGEKGTRFDGKKVKIDLPENSLFSMSGGEFVKMFEKAMELNVSNLSREQSEAVLNAIRTTKENKIYSTEN